MQRLYYSVQEIVDETDRYVDNLRLQRVNAALLTSRLPKHLRKCASHGFGPCFPTSPAKLSTKMPFISV